MRVGRRGQLEGELKAGSWFVVSGDKALIFGEDADRKWQQAMDKRKIPLSRSGERDVRDFEH